MEGEKKRKRAEEGGGGGGMRRKKERDAKEEASPPPEEEVQEFFAILRRMRVAINYFEKGKGNCSGGGSKLTALEAEALAAVDDVKAEKVGGNGGVCLHGVLDLNAVPEVESNNA